MKDYAEKYLVENEKKRYNEVVRKQNEARQKILMNLR